LIKYVLRRCWENDKKITPFERAGKPEEFTHVLWELHEYVDNRRDY